MFIKRKHKMHIVIRSDGGPEIGYGHLVRTSALAELALERGHRVTCATVTPDAAQSVYPDEVRIHPLSSDNERQSFRGWVKNEQPDAVLADSYDFDIRDQRALDEITSCLAVVLDDTHHTICADILINGNAYAPTLEYDYHGDEPRWCLGLDYLLLREDIRTLAQQSPPQRDPPERALVTMGGSDIRGTTPEVLPAFEGTNLIVDIVVGPGFDDENKHEIERVTRETDADIRLLHDPSDLAERMFQADIAVSATGTTSYELLALGTPTIGIPQADNQIPIAEALSDRGAMIQSKPTQLNELSPDIKCLIENKQMRRSLRDKGRELIDGNGTERVYDILLRTARKAPE
jgi:UDP-2,4-diacetamido-2,4,6-trideoxy-beta-L-altropyranose hydrolase